MEKTLLAVPDVTRQSSRRRVRATTATGIVPLPRSCQTLCITAFFVDHASLGFGRRIKLQMGVCEMSRFVRTESLSATGESTFSGHSYSRKNSEDDISIRRAAMLRRLQDLENTTNERHCPAEQLVVGKVLIYKRDVVWDDSVEHATETVHRPCRPQRQSGRVI
jgi:hypothetical protein